MKSVASVNNPVFFQGNLEHSQANRPNAPGYYLKRLGAIFLLAFAMLLGAFFWLLGPPQLSWAAGPPLRYVASGGQDSGNDCSRSYNPCATIQYAVTQADAGDEIRVAGGTYTGTVTLNKSISLRGGFTTTNWVTADPVQHQTTIDAQGGGRVLHNNQFISATVSGFYLTGGQITGGQGAGIYNEGDLTLEDNRIYNNQVVGGPGGGIANIRNTNLTLRGNKIFSNTTDNLGGGLVIYSGTVTIEANEIYNNIAAAGGGIGIFDGLITQKNNLIYENRANNAVAGGGGVYLIDGRANLDNNTVYNNNGDKGGGIYVFNNTVVLTVTNSLIVSNTAAAGNGDGIHFASTGVISNINHNDFFGSPADNKYIYDGSLIDPTTLGSNNRITNPLFTNGLHLSFNSPAKDAASIGASVTEDFEGDGRPFGSAHTLPF